MSEGLSPERFRALADAYGGAVARWPEAVRAEAMRLAAEPRHRAILAQADALDALLDRWQVAAPDAMLRERIERIERIAPAPRMRLSRRVRLWWSGLALATALAGATAGSIAAAAVAPHEHSTDITADTTGATAFGDLAPPDDAQEG